MLQLGLRHVVRSRSNCRPQNLPILFKRSTPPFPRISSLGGNRYFSEQQPYPKFQSPKPTISQRIWYRSDGTPRSKRKGLVIAGISTAILALLYTMLDLLDDLQTACASLIFLVHVQRVDHQYAGKDLNQPTISLAYFESLFRPFIDDENDLKFVLKRFGQLEDDMKNEVHELVKSLHDRLHEVLTRKDTVGKEGEVCFEVQGIVDDVLQKMMMRLNSEVKDKAIKMRKEPRPEKEDDYSILG